MAIKKKINADVLTDGAFLSLRLLNLKQEILSDNLYWLPNAKGVYSGLQKMPASKVSVSASFATAGKVKVTLNNPKDAPVAFFNRLSLIDPNTHQRLLPVFYSDNYVSVLPGEQKVIVLDYNAAKFPQQPLLTVSGWNFKEQTFDIK